MGVSNDQNSDQELVRGVRGDTSVELNTGNISSLDLDLEVEEEEEPPARPRSRRYQSEGPLPPAYSRKDSSREAPTNFLSDEEDLSCVFSADDPLAFGVELGEEDVPEVEVDEGFDPWASLRDDDSYPEPIGLEVEEDVDLASFDGDTDEISLDIDLELDFEGASFDRRAGLQDEEVALGAFFVDEVSDDVSVEIVEDEILVEEEVFAEDPMAATSRMSLNTISSYIEAARQSGDDFDNAMGRLEVELPPWAKFKSGVDGAKEALNEGDSERHTAPTLVKDSLAKVTGEDIARTVAMDRLPEVEPLEVDDPFEVAATIANEIPDEFLRGDALVKEALSTENEPTQVVDTIPVAHEPPQRRDRLAARQFGILRRSRPRSMSSRNIPIRRSTDERSDQIEVEQFATPQPFNVEDASGTELLRQAQLMHKLSRYGDVDRALKRIFSSDPNNHGAQQLKLLNDISLEESLFHQLGDLDGRPSLGLEQSELMSMDIDSRGAFLLSRVDGEYTLRDLIELSPLSRLESAQIFVKFLDEGIIALSREKERDR
jgi:hypothetical protein